MALDPKNTKFVTHKTLSEDWTYVSIPEDDVVIGVKIAVTKVVKLLGPDGVPVKDPNGNPVYSFQSTNVVQLLTTKEYNTIKKTSLT